MKARSNSYDRVVMEKATAEELKVQWVNLCACIDLDSCVNMINVFLDRVQQRLIYCTVQKSITENVLWGSN